MRDMVRLAVILRSRLRPRPRRGLRWGTSPDTRPYRDIAKGHTITAIGGYFSGDGGRFGIAPHNGPFRRHPLRYPDSSSLAMALQVIYGDFDRLIVDPFVPLAEPGRAGPVKQSVTFTEVDIQFNLTGGKTLAPAGPVPRRDVRAQLSRAVPRRTPAASSSATRFPWRRASGFRLFLTRGSISGPKPGPSSGSSTIPSFTREPPDDPAPPATPRGDHRRQRERVGHAAAGSRPGWASPSPLRWRSS